MSNLQASVRIIVFLSLFILSAASVTAADWCYPSSDYNATFDSNSISYSRPAPTLYKDTTETYYFQADVPGSLHIEVTSDGNKIYLTGAQGLCPIPLGKGNGGVFTLDYTSNKPFSVNVIALADNDAAYTITASFVPATIILSKTAFPNQVEENLDSNVTYYIDVTNVSSQNLTITSLSDVFTTTSGVNILDANGTGWNCSQTHPINCTYDANPLQPGTSAGRLYVHTMINTDVDIDNTATVYSKDDGNNPLDPVSDTAPVRVVEGVKQVDLEIVKIAESDRIPIGNDFYYYIFVVNHTNADADLLKVTDTFPADDNITYDQSGSGGNGWTCGPMDDNNNITCYYDQSLYYGITYFKIKAHSSNYDQTVRNTASVNVLNPIDENPDHNTTTWVDVNITTSGGGASPFGGIYAPGGLIEVSDVTLNNSITRDNARIRTKVAGRPNSTLDVYFLDNATSSGVPTGYDANTTKIIPLTVLLRLADENCSMASERSIAWGDNDVEAVFYEGNSMVHAGLDPQNGITSFQWRNGSQKKSRFIMKYIDINAQLDYADESCAVSNLSSNLKGLPQCIANSGGSNKFDTNKYIAAFGYQTFVRCYEENGQPCLSEHHGYGDAPYDHEYGCYECTLGGIGFCSRDNFALRPDRFNVNINSGDHFLANSGTPLTFNAFIDDANVSTLDYNETQASSFNVDIDINDATKQCQDMSLTLVPLVQFRNGIDAGDFNFSNVGYFDFAVQEINGSEFALVDENDTINSDRYITPYTVQMYVIPDHFKIEGNLTDRGPNFTYLSDFNKSNTPLDRNMSASLTLKVSAVDGSDNVMTNYTGNCYAYHTDLTIDLQQPPSADLTQLPPALNHLLVYDDFANVLFKPFPLDDNTLPATAPLIPAATFYNNRFILHNLPAFFKQAPNPATDTNGSVSVRYRINFDRKPDKAHLVNPVVMQIDDINISEMAVALPPTLPAADGGYHAVANNKATFYYGRLHAPRYRVVGNADNITLYYEVYCSPDGDATGLPLRVCDLRDHIPVLPNRTLSVDDIHWYVNEQHQNIYGDINISAPGGGITERPGIPGNPITESWQAYNAPFETWNVQYDPTNRGYPFKATMRMWTNWWLVYNIFNDNPPNPTVDFELEFNSGGVWQGTSTGNISVDSNASVNTNRRVEW